MCIQSILGLFRWFALCFRWGRFAFRRGAESLSLQAFHHHARSGMPFFGEVVGLSDQGFELTLHFLCFLQRRILIALYHAKIAPLDPKLQALKSEKNQQRDQRDDQRQIRWGIWHHDDLGIVLVYVIGFYVVGFFGHRPSFL